MPRIYVRKGELRRNEAVTVMFTKAERDRLATAAQKFELPTAVFVRKLVIKELESAA